MVAASPKNRNVPSWHKAFLALLPAIQKHARFAFRYLPEEAREDAVHEVIANSLVAFVRLYQAGKQDLIYPSVLVRYAVAQFHAGRRVGSRHCKRDVYNGEEYKLQHIGSPRDQRHGGWREQLVEGRASTVPDLAAMRIDFPEWLNGLKRRDRKVALKLANGERTLDVAEKFGISTARVSQIRRQLESNWQAFHDKPVAA